MEGRTAWVALVLAGGLLVAPAAAMGQSSEIRRAEPTVAEPKFQAKRIIDTRYDGASPSPGWLQLTGIAAILALVIVKR